MSEIDSRAVISPRARLGAGVQIGAYAVVGDDVELGEGCVLQQHAVVQGPARLGRGISSFFRGDWRRSAGSQVCGRESVARNWRREYFSRILHRESRHGERRRHHADGQSQFVMTYAHIGARRSDWQPHGFRQRRDAGRPRDRGRLCDDRRILPGASVLPHRAACLHCGAYGDHAGRAAIFESWRRARRAATA